MRRVSAILLVAFVVGVGVQSACGGDRKMQFPTGQAIAGPAPGAALFRMPGLAAPESTAEPFGFPTSATPAPTAGWSRTSTSVAPTPTAGWSRTSTPVAAASAVAAPTAAPSPASTPAVTPSAAPAPTATPSPASTPAATASATLTSTAAPTRSRELETESRGPASRTPRSEVPGLIPVPALGNPEAECEAVADSHAAALQFYQAGTATSSRAWNDYLSAHNSGQADPARVSRLRQSYDRISANLDRSLLTMAASQQVAHDLEADQRGRCALDQVAGKRYRPLPPARG